MNHIPYQYRNLPIPVAVMSPAFCFTQRKKDFYMPAQILAAPIVMMRKQNVGLV